MFLKIIKVEGTDTINSVEVLLRPGFLHKKIKLKISPLLLIALLWKEKIKMEKHQLEKIDGRVLQHLKSRSEDNKEFLEILESGKS